MMTNLNLTMDIDTLISCLYPYAVNISFRKIIYIFRYQTFIVVLDLFHIDALIYSIK